MTISVEARAAAIKRVLIRLSELSWDADLCDFGEADLAGTSPLCTTLAELEAKNFIELVVFLSDPHPYRLTSEGWFNAHRIAGRFETEDFNERRARLCAALKNAVKGRQEEAMLKCDEVAQYADLPAGWVLNMVETQTLYTLDPHGRYWLRFESGLIYIPTTFGQLEAPL